MSPLPPLPVSCNLMHCGLSFLRGLFIAWRLLKSLDHLTLTPVRKAVVSYFSFRDTVCDLLCFTVFLLWFHSTRGDYGQGDKKEKFRFARTLVCIQCIISALFAKICEYVLYKTDTQTYKRHPKYMPELVILPGNFLFWILPVKE